MPFRMFHRCWMGVPQSLALIMALVSQLALGSMVLPDQAPPDAVGVLCGHHPHERAPAAPAHHHDSAALCPLSVTLALPMVVLASDVVVPLPRSVTLRRAAIAPSARDPPALLVRVGSPRGPPVLV